jgi:RNA polymerase sigma-70 factor (ECF subfamily)
MHEEDRDLAKQMAQGRDPAFKRFFDLYFPKVYRFCCRRLSEQAAEEVTQTVLINAIRSIGSYRGEASLFTWLCQIARHEVSTHYRRESLHNAVVPMDESDEMRAGVGSLSEDPDLAPEHGIDRSRSEAFVHLILDHLPGDYGRVLEWKYIDGYSVDEIAGRLATTPIAVQSMLARARGAFRTQYEALNAEAASKAAALYTRSN